MKWTKTFIPTVKEDPQEAEAISHKLMIRSGLIRRLTAGAYTYLPLGHKILQKVKNIIREELEKVGAIEILMSAIQPKDLWEKTNRYNIIGEVMIKYKDRHGKEMVLGPTHEEIVTDLVSKEIKSYKDLPIILYQIQTKFRDEMRPRFGIIRSCEFIMKDAYSFDVDIDSMEKNYNNMYKAYCNIFEKCGLPYIAVEADSGLMGGKVSHEFMVPSQIGEDKIIICTKCKYAASIEVAEIKQKERLENKEEPLKQKQEIDTPGISTIKDITEYLKIEATDLIKTLIYIADDNPIALLLRGDHEANEAKIKKQLNIQTLKLANNKEIEQITNTVVGFEGPIGLTIPIIADNTIKNMQNFIIGANKKDKHIKNANIDIDFKIQKFIDARTITNQDVCPKCGGKIDFKHVIEIGHTFKLGTKYSKPLKAVYLDNNGKENYMIMGCYGIGVNRILASLIESSHDKDGIIWPISISPYEVVIIPVKTNDKETYEESEKIYEQLKKEKIDVLFDDRDKSIGIKFKDSDLIGFPIQIIIGKKNLEKNLIEIKNRATKESILVEKHKILETIKNIIFNCNK